MQERVNAGWVFPNSMSRPSNKHSKNSKHIHTYTQQDRERRRTSVTYLSPHKDISGPFSRINMPQFWYLCPPGASKRKSRQNRRGLFALTVNPGGARLTKLGIRKGLAWHEKHASDSETRRKHQHQTLAYIPILSLEEKTAGPARPAEQRKNKTKKI